MVSWMKLATRKRISEKELALLADEVARQLAYEEQCAEATKKQKRKGNKKKGTCGTLSEAKMGRPVNKNKASTTAVEGNRKVVNSKKKKKKKKKQEPGRPLHEQREAATLSADNMDEEEADSTTRQIPVREQQVLASAGGKGASRSHHRVDEGGDPAED